MFVFVCSVVSSSSSTITCFFLDSSQQVFFDLWLCCACVTGLYFFFRKLCCGEVSVSGPAFFPPLSSLSNTHFLCVARRVLRAHQEKKKDRRVFSLEKKETYFYSLNVRSQQNKTYFLQHAFWTMVLKNVYFNIYLLQDNVHNCNIYLNKFYWLWVLLMLCLCSSKDSHRMERHNHLLDTIAQVASLVILLQS